MTHGALRLPPNVQELVWDFQDKWEELNDVYIEFHDTVEKVKRSTSVLGAFGGSVFRQEPSLFLDDMRKVLTKSAWYALANMLRFSNIATYSQWQEFEHKVESGMAFTPENITNEFEEVVMNPRETILRGLVEQFVRLDPAFKSHTKVKIGKEGLPKRVVLTGYRDGWTNTISLSMQERIRQILRPLGLYMGCGVPETHEIGEMFRKVELGQRFNLWRDVDAVHYKNGNVHLFFGDISLNAINHALAEWYGKVLPDCHDEDMERKPNKDFLPAKDLQFYRTPDWVADLVVGYADLRDGDKILEPSCGDGSLIGAMLRHGEETEQQLEIVGVEIDVNRARIAKERFPHVVVRQGNFLDKDFHVGNEYDKVVMNPPFYGTHWSKHIARAVELLRDGGKLISVLPATAWLEHRDLLPSGGMWHDLPVGAFRESGTGINTGVFVWRKE